MAYYTQETARVSIVIFSVFDYYFTLSPDDRYSLYVKHTHAYRVSTMSFTLTTTNEKLFAFSYASSGYELGVACITSQWHEPPI